MSDEPPPPIVEYRRPSTPHRRPRRSDPFWIAARYLVLAVVGLACVVPLAVMLSVNTKDDGTASGAMLLLCGPSAAIGSVFLVVGLRGLRRLARGGA